MLKETQGVILAGGLGKRMGELTIDRQKCLLNYHGDPILKHVLDNIIQAYGSAEVTVCLGYLGQQIKEYFGFEYRTIKLHYVHDPKSLETRRRLLLAKEYLPGPFFMLPGDVICKPEQISKIAEMYESEKNNTNGIISAASYHEPALTHALIRIQDEKLVEMVYPPTSTWKPQYHREMGVAFYSNGFLSLLQNAPQDYKNISHVINHALNNRENFLASIYTNRWYHFAYPEDLKIPFDSSFSL